MLLVIFFILLSICTETALHAVPAGQTVIRKFVAMAAVFAFCISAVIALQHAVNVWSILLLVLYAYRAFNLLRIIKNRMHAQYLWRVTYRTGVWLMAVQLTLGGLWILSQRYTVSAHVLLQVALALQLVVSLIFLRTLLGHVRRMRAAAEIVKAHDADLPSLTVAIPARNETNDLHACITSLLKSHYPKLEILVLDDCSQTRRTPEIIRSFAHDGVRFIKGEEPKAAWLAKNQAYDALAKAASGELILFAGVDIRFEAQSLRQLVAYALAKHKTMVCVMPRNILPRRAVPMIQPMRYVWELVWPRKLVRRPPVLSSCWLISKEALMKAGGFKSVSRTIVPEAHFAHEQITHDGYSFVASGTTFGITSEKTTAAQRETAVRVGYPQTHRRPEMAVAITAGYVAWTVMPLIGIIAVLLSRVFDISGVLVALIIAINMWFYSLLFRLAYGRAPWLAVLSLPIAALVYVALLHYSMYKYEFSEVIWKDRNVCLPVMHVTPKLPSI